MWVEPRVSPHPLPPACRSSGQDATCLYVVISGRLRLMHESVHPVTDKLSVQVEEEVRAVRAGRTLYLPRYTASERHAWLHGAGQSPACLMPLPELGYHALHACMHHQAAPPSAMAQPNTSKHEHAARRLHAQVHPLDMSCTTYVLERCRWGVVRLLVPSGP